MKKFTLFVALAGTALVLTLTLSSAVLASTLTAADCVKCHEQESALIMNNGAAHKSEIDCQACHEGHRPKVANNIPDCSNCHAGSDHYAVGGCLTCHNPHEPLNVKLTAEHKTVCVSCHAGPAKEMAANPSKHETFACNFCHADTHGMIPSCTDCHDPHSASMTADNCAACHQAHQPMLLTYAANTASPLCGSCHETAFSQLTASKSKHNQVACVACHADKHKTVPQCSDCHGQPHATGIHDRFPKCGECHSTAHDLNNWPAQDKKQKK